MMFQNFSLTFLAFYFAIYIGESTATTVSVTFYGESQCPMCREWVTKNWQEIWTDADLMQYVEFDFVAWGNAYFTTDKCGGGPYSAETRACWYDACIISSSDNEDECFGGDVVYQHSKKEGDVDIYEMCVKKLFGLIPAVDFMICSEGSNMDNSTQSAEELMRQCLPPTFDPAIVETCFETEGHLIEVSSAKQTPKHPGVPYVIVDGVALDDPFTVKTEICSRLQDSSVEIRLPTTCEESMVAKEVLSLSSY